MATIYACSSGAARFNEFRQLLPGISPTTLSERLDQLEAAGLEACRADEDRRHVIGFGCVRARNHLVRRAIAAQRVDRDPRQGYGAGVRSGSMSRPLYVLHVGQTRCGRFGCPQVGHVFTRGDSMPCWARRLSRRAFDVFFFGTAMSGCRV
jgi:hypothetical protein